VLTDRAAGSALRALDALLLPGVAALLAYASLAQGAFYWPQAALVGALALALAVAAAVRAPRLLTQGTLGFALLAGGLLASSIAAGWPVQLRLPAAALAAGAGCFLAGRRLVQRGDRDAVLLLLASSGAAVAALGLIGIALHHSPWAMFATHLWRLASTITYANAAGAMLLLALPAALLLSIGRPRALPRLATYLILTGLVASLSRGAFAGAAVFVVVALALGGRPGLRELLRPLAGTAVASLALLPSIVGPARPALAIAGLALGAAVTAVPVPPSARRLLKRAGVLAAIAVALATPLLIGKALPRFMESRFDVSADPRFAAWGATLSLAMEHPVLGTGPGTFLVDPSSGQSIVARFAHNEYLQTLAETGFVGLASVLGAVAAFAIWAFRRRAGTTSALAIAVCAGFLVHSAFDFLWRFPILVSMAFLWLALAPNEPQEAHE
jgi:O-antigen ligase